MKPELMPRTTSRDLSGIGVFSRGDAGQAHVMAHRMLDEERYELGHRLLERWLKGRTGSGSDWTHLQWHVAVFEIAVGRWDEARERFEREILPVATHSDDALTDGPAMIWRLWLSAPRPVDLDWESVREMAVRNLRRTQDPYAELRTGPDESSRLADAAGVEPVDEV